MQQVSLDLLQKYNVPIPRYTSYPTVPYWDDTIDVPAWKSLCAQRFEESREISLYLHLPFCESLCTFCGCNKRITTNHAVEETYLLALLKEWEIYRDMMPHKPVIRELHLGGGTPTFFSPGNLKHLIESILADAVVPEEHEFGFEGHPNNTTREHLHTLFQLGFNRVSFGMQDSNPEVQKVINRIQPHANVVQVVQWAREIGYESVNLDLVYGLPLQTLARLEQTIQDALEIKPDRVAFYSYAHVPWTSKAQRLFDENDLPDAGLKTKLYTTGKVMFAEAGYTDIGMDHFSLPSDELFRARMNGKLHRNFMGYTDTNTKALIGLGVSAISDIGVAYAQNYKELESYYQAIERNEIPVIKGYFMDESDLVFKQYILDTICRGTTTFKDDFRDLLNEYSIPLLLEMEKDGLLTYSNDKIEITKAGFHFVRNICKAFDIRWLTDLTNQGRFSKAV